MAEEPLRVRRISHEIVQIRQRSWSGLTVNFYLLVGEGRLALVDAGFPSRGRAVLEGLRAHGLAPESIDRVFYTHTHVDHMGGGPDLARLLGAEHVVWRECASVARDWRAHQARLSDWDAWAEEVVDDRDLLSRWMAHRRATRVKRERWRDGPGTIEPVRPTDPGERLTAGPFRLELVPVPGHDPYHVVLYDRDRRIAFTGDVILPVPTPITRPMGDDTGTYLDSLARLSELPVVKAFPGHGNPFENYAHRLDRSRRFVLERHEAIRDLLLREGALTTFDLARAMAGEFADDESRFPLFLASVDSSVRYLVECGELRLVGRRVSLAEAEARPLASPES